MIGRATGALPQSMAMVLSDSRQPTDVLVRCGHKVQQLTLRRLIEGETAVLVDAAGSVIDPQTVTLLRWPAGSGLALQRSGYQITPYPDPAEPWCNCTD